MFFRSPTEFIFLDVVLLLLVAADESCMIRPVDILKFCGLVNSVRITLCTISIVFPCIRSVTRFVYFLA